MTITVPSSWKLVSHYGSCLYTWFTHVLKQTLALIGMWPLSSHTFDGNHTSTLVLTLNKMLHNGKRDILVEGGGDFMNRPKFIFAVRATLNAYASMRGNFMGFIL